MFFQMFDVDLLSWRLICNLDLRFTPCLFQMFDVDLLSWRLICNLNLRFTPSFLGLHNNNIIIAGWCPAR